jgi:GNAT superfamily N-acetyltransferase
MIADMSVGKHGVRNVTKARTPASPIPVGARGGARRIASRSTRARISTGTAESRAEQPDSKIPRAGPTDAVALTQLLHVGYAEHIVAGLNFTAGTQDKVQTLKDIRDREVYVIRRGTELLATVMVTLQTPTHARSRLYVSHLAVDPGARATGRGRRLLDFVERLAKRRGIAVLRLDTTKQLIALIEAYERRGYARIGARQWKGKTYQSVLMEKVMGQRRPARSTRRAMPR